VSSDDDSYEVRLSRSAQKYLHRVEAATCRRLVEALSGMEQNPWTGDVQPVRGHPDRWRRRLGGLRVVYSVDRRDGIVYVLTIAPRGEAYEP